VEPAAGERAGQHQGGDGGKGYERQRPPERLPVGGRKARGVMDPVDHLALEDDSEDRDAQRPAELLEDPDRARRAWDLLLRRPR
jgi:hypothetical protein